MSSSSPAKNGAPASKVSSGASNVLDSLRFFAATDVGQVRTHNEDNFLVDSRLGLFVVADGMGGHAAGEIASALAVRQLHDILCESSETLTRFTKGEVSAKEILALLSSAVQRASSRIHEQALSDGTKRGMGTTLSALLFLGDRGFVAHVGDSRIYLLRNGRISQITDDHTVINELVKRGKLSREQIDRVAQKNAITRAVGVYERVEVDTLLVETAPGDSFLLCSDGLHGYFNTEEELIPYLEASMGEQCAAAIVAVANERGGKDNITAVIVRFEGNQDDEAAARAKKLETKQRILGKMPLFTRLSKRELLRVMQIADVVAYRDGEYIIREGQVGDELFVVLSGQVKVSAKDMYLTTLGAGDHLGELALLRNTPRNMTATSDGPSELVRFRRHDFFEILRSEPELSVKLLWQFLGVIADRLDQTTTDLGKAREQLETEDLTEEVFLFIEGLCPTPPLGPRPQAVRRTAALGKRPRLSDSSNRPDKIAVLAMASFFKGNRFLETAKKEGATVYLLTVEKLLSQPWVRESIDEVFALRENFQNREELLNVVSWLARTRKIDRVVPMDDFDVETAALVREHLRVPGMGETTARYFRDKLAMREKARDSGITVPPFVHILNHAEVAKFMEEVPGPWVLKPRSEAGSIGIKKIHSPEELWPLVEALGDKQSHHLLEQMIPGDVYHVDSIVSERAIVFAQCHRYRRPILGVVQGGGLFGSRTLPYDTDEERKLLAFHAETLSALGFIRGVAHTEFIKSQVDGKFYFLETGARVGGAHIADLVEHETGVDLWAEWAKLEIPHGKWGYTPPKRENHHAGLIISLSKDKTPDMSAYDDADIVWKLTMDHHAGLVVRCADEATLDRRMDELEKRIANDFMAVLPAPDKATH